MPATTWRGLLAEACERLDGDDARRIVEQAAGRGRAEMVLHLNDRVPDRALPYVHGLVERRAGGEPLQYVVGRWGFRTLDLLVDPRVLIPRPETEQVVAEALGELRPLDTSAGAGPTLVADLGTGSGAIALSLAVEGGAQVWATDQSDDALMVARANLAGVGGRAATRVVLTCGSWYEALPDDLKGRFRLVVSNPPYVADHEIAALDAEITDWEPLAALVPGPTGLEAIEEIVGEAPEWLDPPGSLVVELAPAQADAVIRLAQRAGFAHAEVRPDLAGRPRTLVARL